jgi:hypothetical protein
MTIRVRIDLVDHAATAGRDRGAGIARDDGFHAGADKGRVGANQRHRLALHVRAHQRAVGVVVLQERDQRRGNRNELLGRDVHHVDVLSTGVTIAVDPADGTRSSTIWPSFSSMLAWAIVYFASSIAEM